MASSGIKATEYADVMKAFNDVKMKSRKFSAIKLHLNKEGKKVSLVYDETIANSGKNEDDFNSLVEKFEDAKPAYGVFNVSIKTSDGRMVEKLVLISWCPDDAPALLKMPHAGTVGNLLKSFEGTYSSCFHAADKGDLTYDDVVKHCS